MANIKDICQAYKAAGLYTHVYVSCGFLYEENDRFSLSIGDDTRIIFDLASLTKALVTTPLVLWRCYERGVDPRTTKLSELFGSVATSQLGAARHDYKVGDYLRHETGLPFWRNFYVECSHKKQTLNDVLNRSYPEGHSKDVYSDVGFLVLGDLLEVSSGESLLRQWWQKSELICALSSLEMGPGKIFDPKVVIPTGYCAVRRRDLCGDVHDENCWALGGFKGHAGLFGSGESLSKYLRELWQADLGRAVFLENFRECDSPGDSLMGWRKGRDSSSFPFADGRGCGHMGFTGTAFWVDPVTKAYAIVLTNRVVSGRLSPTMKSFRAEAFASLWQLVKDS